MNKDEQTRNVFSDVALEHAKNAYYLKLARTEYGTQRDSLVAELADVVESSLGDSKLQLSERKREKAYGVPTSSFYFEGDCFAARAERNPQTADRDGFYFGFFTDEEMGADEPALAFRVHLYFRAGRTTYRKLRSEVTAIAKEQGGLSGLSGKWIWISLAPVLPEACTRERLEDAVAELPTIFEKVDARLARAYRAAWSMGPTEPEGS